MDSALFHKRFLRFVGKHELFSKTDHVLAAVSGGMDSVVMCELLHKNKFQFSIAHMNFKLREVDSDLDEDFVKDLAEKYEVKYFGYQVDTRSYAKQNCLSIEMAARELRYTWFGKLLIAYNFDYVTTAHHQNDQTESILLNLTRGTALKGYQGIKPKNNHLIRPLLFANRKEIEAFALEMKLSFRTDKSNENIDFQRNRVRKNVIPELEQINPSLHETISRNTEYLQNYIDFVEQNMNKVKAQLCKSLKDNLFINFTSIRNDRFFRLYLFELLNEFGFNSAQLDNIVESVNSQSGIQFISPTHVLIRDREQFVISPIRSRNQYVIAVHDIHEIIHYESSEFTFNLITNLENEDLKNPFHAYLEMDLLTFPLSLRKWGNGDVFHPFGMKGAKKVSDYLTDIKLNRFDKENTIVVLSNSQIIWVAPYRIDDRYKVSQDSKKILKVVLKQK